MEIILEYRILWKSIRIWIQILLVFCKYSNTNANTNANTSVTVFICILRMPIIQNTNIPGLAQYRVNIPNHFLKQLNSLVFFIKSGFVAPKFPWICNVHQHWDSIGKERYRKLADTCSLPKRIQECLKATPYFNWVRTSPRAHAWACVIRTAIQNHEIWYLKWRAALEKSSMDKFYHNLVHMCPKLLSTDCATFGATPRALQLGKCVFLWYFSQINADSNEVWSK